MEPVYHAISAILLFWHSAWEHLLGEATALRTDWTWVLGIVFLVLTVRTVLIPVVVRQVRSQRALQVLQPRISALRDKHRGDPLAMQQELAALYKTEKISPFATFLPLLLQAPVLFGLLHVLRHVRPEITSEASRTLYGWTLTQFDSAAHAELFGAPIAATFSAGPLTVKLVAAVLILSMVVTTYLSSRQMIRKAGAAAEGPARIMQQVMLYGIPLSLLISGVIFPIGVVLYWLTQNLFALGQQAWLLRRFPLPATPGAEPASTPPRRTATTKPQVGARPSRNKSERYGGSGRRSS